MACSKSGGVGEILQNTPLGRALSAEGTIPSLYLNPASHFTTFHFHLPKALPFWPLDAPSAERVHSKRAFS